MTAPQAAGVIHSDFEKGFIRAETVINYGWFYLNSQGFASHVEIMFRFMDQLTQFLETWVQKINNKKSTEDISVLNLTVDSSSTHVFWLGQYARKLQKSLMLISNINLD